MLPLPALAARDGGVSKERLQMSAEIRRSVVRRLWKGTFQRGAARSCCYLFLFVFVFFFIFFFMQWVRRP